MDREKSCEDRSESRCKLAEDLAPDTSTGTYSKQEHCWSNYGYGKFPSKIGIK